MNIKMIMLISIISNCAIRSTSGHYNHHTSPTVSNIILSITLLIPTSKSKTIDNCISIYSLQHYDFLGDTIFRSKIIFYNISSQVLDFETTSMQQSDEENHQQSNQTKLNTIKQTFKRTCISYGLRRSYCQLIWSSLAVIKTQDNEEKYKIITYGLADQINLLKKGESPAQKIEELFQEREEVLRLLRLELMARRNQKLLKVHQCCQYLQHFRMYNLLVLEHLQTLRNQKMIAESQYQSQIITGLLFDSDFIRLSQLRKYIEFSKSYDPLFMIPLKKFWNLERTSDDNKRVIIDLFTISEEQRERLEKSDQYLRQFLKKHEHKLKKSHEQGGNQIYKSDKDPSILLYKPKTQQEQTLSKFVLPSIAPKSIAVYSQEKSNKIGSSIHDIIKIHQQRKKELKNIESKRIKDLKAKRRSTTQVNEYAKKPNQISLQNLRNQQKIAKRKAYLLDQYNKDEPESDYKNNQKPKRPFFRNQSLPLPIKGTLIEQKPSKQSERGKIQLTQTNYNQILDILKQKSQINLPKQKKSQQKQQRNRSEDEKQQYEVRKHKSSKYRKNKIVVRSQQSKLKQTVSHGHWIRESNQKSIDEGIIYPRISNFNFGEQENRQKLISDKVNEIERVSVSKSRIKNQEKKERQIEKFNNPLEILQNIRGKKQEIQLNLMQKKIISVSPQPINLYIQSDSKRTSRNRGILQSKQSLTKSQSLQIQSNFNQTLNKELLPGKIQSTETSDIPIIKRIKKNLGFISSNVNYSFGTQKFGNNQQVIVTPSPQPRASPKKNRIITSINQIISIPPTKSQMTINPFMEKKQTITQTEFQQYQQNVKPSKMLNHQSGNTGENNRLVQVQSNKRDLSDSFCQTDEVRNNNMLLITDNSKYATKTQYIKVNSFDNKNESLTNYNISNDPPIFVSSNVRQSNNNISIISEKKPTRQINIFDQTQRLQQHNISLLNQSLNRSKQSIIRPDQQKIRLNLTKQQLSILQKCTFQSKSYLQQQLQFKIKKYSKSNSQKIIQYTNKHYFMNRHIILSTCSYNNEVISYSLSSPHLTQEHRYLFIIYLEVIKKEFHNILNKFLATFIKYMFFNDPTDYVIYLQIKDIFYKNYVECFESINNYSGVIKTPIKSPYFDDQSYMFQRKDIKCNKVQDYTTIFNTLTLFIANKKSKAPLQSLKLNQLYISSSYLNFIHKSIKQNQGKYYPKLKDLQKYLQSQSFPTFKQKTLQQGIILHQNLQQDCLTKIRFYVYSNFCYFTIQPPYTLFYEGKEVNFVLVATNIKNRYFILADKIYEESENIDIYKQMKNQLFGKKAKELLYSEKTKGKIVSCPLFQKAVEFSLSEDVYGIVSFSLNWKDYMKGARYFREDANTFELIGPFLCGYLQLDDQGRIHHLYSTIINEGNLQK